MKRRESRAICGESKISSRSTRKGRVCSESVCSQIRIVPKAKLHLFQVTKLLTEETELANNLRDVLTDIKDIKSLKIDTAYEEGSNAHVIGTERGDEVCPLSMRKAQH
jgi:hypothetical protein